MTVLLQVDEVNESVVSLLPTKLNQINILFFLKNLIYKPFFNGISLAASANFSASSTSKSDFKLSKELPYILNDGAS
jgi:hypothetical protein